MALTWAGVITILFLAAACVRGYRRGLIKELVSLVCVFLSMAIDPVHLASLTAFRQVLPYRNTTSLF